MGPSFKTRGVADPGLKTGGVEGPQNSTDAGTQHRSEGIIPGIFIQL